ncbi:MAG: MFS transporter [Candidatus Margulisiibacteriota bacterium]
MESEIDTPGIWQKIPKAFEALKYPNYRNFWFNEGVSNIGLWIQMIAQGWLVYDMTGSKFLLGLINTIAGLPLLFFSPIGGIIADHQNKKNLLIATQIVFAALSFLIGALIFTGGINFNILAVIVFLIGIATAIDSPARQAFVAELVAPRSLGNAIALNSLAFNTTRIIGPAIAGYIIGFVSIESCYFINATTFTGVIMALFFLKGDFNPKTKSIVSARSAFAEGLKYILKNKKVLFSLVLVAFTSIFIMPYTILMPVFARDIFHSGAQGLGTLMAFSGLGALTGAFMLAQFSGRIDLIRLIFASTFLIAASLLVFASSSVLYISMAALAVLGWGIVSQAASVNTYIQNEVPNNLRGRIVSFYVLSFMGLMPLGSFISGLAAQHFGAPAALASGALISLIPITGFIVFNAAKQL